jgi:hypothetical protein
MKLQMGKLITIRLCQFTTTYGEQSKPVCVTFFDARLSRGTSSADSRVLVSRMGSGVGQNRGSGEFSGRANGSGKGD